MNPRQQEAFEYYYSLGSDRSHSKVAKKFDMSTTTVKRYSKDFGWSNLIRERDRGVSSAIKEVGEEEAIATALEVQKMTTSIIRKAYAEFLAGKVKFKNIADIEKAFKIYLEVSKMVEHSEEEDEQIDNLASLVEALKNARALRDSDTEKNDKDSEKNFHADNEK